MKRYIFLAIAAVIVGTGCAFSQSYPTTDADGNTLYYKIMSAYPEYSDMCITDNTSNSSTVYKFLIKENDPDDLKQQFSLVVDVNGTDTAYYLRNRKTRKYISSKTNWDGRYYASNYYSVRFTITPCTFEDISDGQIAMKIITSSDTCYLMAADSAETMPSFDVYSLKDSRWAWKVCDASGVPVSINEIVSGSNVKVSVVDRVIKVEGTDNYTIYNDEGVAFPKETVLTPGIYFVDVKRLTYKVLVK